MGLFYSATHNSSAMSNKRWNEAKNGAVCMLKLNLLISRARKNSLTSITIPRLSLIFSHDFVQVEAEVRQPRRGRPQPRGDGGGGARDAGGDGGPRQAGALPPQQQDLPWQQVRGGQGQGSVIVFGLFTLYHVSLCMKSRKRTCVRRRLSCRRWSASCSAPCFPSSPRWPPSSGSGTLGCSWHPQPLPRPRHK